MSRYIDLEELERRIKENVTTSGAGNTPYEVDLLDWCKDECIRQGYAMPTADVVEVVHARWIEESSLYVHCSICKTREYPREHNFKSKICPNCGAKMDGERSEK